MTKSSDLKKTFTVLSNYFNRRLVEVPAESDRWWVQEEMKDSDNYSDTDDNGSAVRRDNEQNGGMLSQSM